MEAGEQFRLQLAEAMAATKTLLSEAIKHHQTGRLSDAEHLYESAIAADPLNGEALHLLGLLALQSSRGNLAVELISRAISVDGTNATYHVNHGVALEQLGRLDESLDSYDVAIGLKPNYAQAFYNRANALHELGRLEEALASYEAAIRINPDFALAYIGQGKIRQQLGLLNDALLSYEAALRITSSAEAHFRRGNSLYSLERFEEALLSYDFALQVVPDHAEAAMAKGATLHRLGKIDAALGCFDTAIDIRPDLSEAHYSRGNALQDLERFEEAITAYDIAVGIKPDYTEALFNRGVALQRLGRSDEALGTYDQVLLAQPTHLQTLLNRGNIFHSLSRYTDALDAFDAALEISPASVQAHSGRGAALHDLGKIEEALVSYENALRVDPNYAEAYSGRGAAQHDLGRLDDALLSYSEAMRAQPDNAEAHTNRGLTLLLKGELEEGWPEYAWRWKTRGSRSITAAQARLRSAPLWTGEPGKGRRILVWSEQGLGDTIQFARFISAVEARGWRVIFEVPQQLVRLFRPLNTPQISVTASGDTLPEYDVQCPLLDLPRILAAPTTAIAGGAPYLQAEDDLRSFWRPFLPSKGCRVGIVWQGSPRHRNDRNRSVPLKYFSALSAPSDVHLISLQKDHGVDQLDESPAGRQIQTLGDEYAKGGFHDTAALIMELDLVITVDTSVAHLAGALGRPVWIALPRVPDWRWQMFGSHSFWYPTARLFRQRTQNDWDSVFTAIARDLAESRGHA